MPDRILVPIVRVQTESESNLESAFSGAGLEERRGPNLLNSFLNSKKFSSTLFHIVGRRTASITAGHRKAHAGGEQAAHMHMRQTRRRQHRVVDVVVGAKAGARRRQRARQGGESRTITTWRTKTRTRIVGEAAG